MALKHDIDTEFGPVAKHFTINRIDLYPRDGFLEVGLNGFATKQDKTNGKKNISTFTRRFEYTPAVLEVSQDLETLAYDLIKLEPEFVGATDEVD